MKKDSIDTGVCLYGKEAEVIGDGRPGDKALRRCRRRRISLKRTLELPAIFSIAYGNLGSTVYFALGVIALHALGATPLVIFMAAVFFLFTAMAYAEGTAAIPEAGGSSSFARKGFNELVSFIAGWCLLLGYIAASAVAAFSAVSYLGSLSELAFLKTPFWNFSASGLLLLALMIINIIGVRESSVLSIIFAVADVLTQLFIVLVGSLFFLNMPKILSRIHLGFAPSWSQLAIALYLVMISFTGIETVSNLAEESKQPEKNIPKSMWWSAGIIIFLFLGIANVSMGAMPVSYEVEGYIYSLDAKKTGSDNVSGDGNPLFYYRASATNLSGAPEKDVIVSGGEGFVKTDEKGYFKLDGLGAGQIKLKIQKSGHPVKIITFDNRKPGQDAVQGRWTSELSDKWINAPISGIVSKLPVFREPLEFWVAILAFTILVIATNAGMLGFSRLVFSMGSYRQIPPFLAKVHPRFRTPYIAIILFSAAAFLIILSGRIEKMAEVYAFSAMISYAIAHVSIIAMRIRLPRLERPYRIPLNLTVSGRQIPVTSVIGAFICSVLWVVVMIKQDFGRSVGIPFVAAGILMYIVYRYSQGLSLTETVDESKRM